MKSQEIWTHIHTERGDLADMLETLAPEQWHVPSWCEGWSVAETVGHVVAAAEQTPLNFFKEMATAGFKFNVFAERDARRIAKVGPAEMIRRLRARITTTNHPPAPVMAMLGEVIVHGDDVRRPLGLVHRSPGAALIAVADGWKESNLLIGSKRRITACACAPPTPTGHTVSDRR